MTGPMKGAAPRPPMRAVHCPICAGLITQRVGVFSCLTSSMDTRLGHALRAAVYRADPPRQPPRPAPELADYLWCPNCTGAMDDFDERGRELRCAGCGLSFPSVLQLDLLEWKNEWHAQPDDERWDQAVEAMKRRS